MAHLNRIWTDSILVRGFVTGVEIKDLDVNTYKAINGDDGGSWTPSSPIIIGGEGMVAAGRGWVAFGAGFSLTTGVGAPIEFGKGDKYDYFGFDSANTMRSPSVITKLNHPVSMSPNALTGYGIPVLTELYIKPYYSTDRNSSLLVSGDTETVQPLRFLCPLNVYNGAPTITSVTLKFAVGTAHASLPQYMPRMRVIAVSHDGDEIIPLRAPGSSTDGDGFQAIAAPVNGTSWYNGGAEQTFVYNCNVSHTIDIEKYSYYVEIIEEYGSNSFTAGNGNSYYSVTALFGNVTVFDGRN